MQSLLILPELKILFTFVLSSVTASVFYNAAKLENGDWKTLSFTGFKFEHNEGEGISIDVSLLVCSMSEIFWVSVTNILGIIYEWSFGLYVKTSPPGVT